MGWHHAQAKWYTYAAEETVEQGSAVEKKMQDIIRFYTQTSHGFHFTIYFPIGPCEETSSTWGAREGRRADSRASRLGARNRTPRGGRAGSRAFLLTPSAFPLDFWQRRYIYSSVGYMYCLCIGFIAGKLPQSHSAKKSEGCAQLRLTHLGRRHQCYTLLAFLQRMCTVAAPPAQAPQTSSLMLLQARKTSAYHAPTYRTSVLPRGRGSSQSGLLESPGPAGRPRYGPNVRGAMLHFPNSKSCIHAHVWRVCRFFGVHCRKQLQRGALLKAAFCLSPKKYNTNVTAASAHWCFSCIYTRMPVHGRSHICCRATCWAPTCGRPCGWSSKTACPPRRKMSDPSGASCLCRAGWDPDQVRGTCGISCSSSPCFDISNCFQNCSGSTQGKYV